jgi:hypothetical protein
MINDEHAQRFFDMALDLEDLTPDEIRAAARDLQPNVPTSRRAAFYLGLAGILNQSPLSNEEERRVKLEAWREGLGIDEAEARGIVDAFLRESAAGRARAKSDGEGRRVRKHEGLSRQQHCVRYCEGRHCR